MDARKNAAIRKLKRSNNAWGKLIAKYEAEMFASLPAEHAARAKPSERLIQYRATSDGQVVAGLVADILGLLGHVLLVPTIGVANEVWVRVTGSGLGLILVPPRNVAP